MTIDIIDIKVNLETQSLSDTEQTILAQLFNQPVVKKYLNILIANQITDFANIPLNVLATDGAHISSIKQAFLKGGLSMLQTLNDIRMPEPTSVQANQGQQTQQIRS